MTTVGVAVYHTVWGAPTVRVMVRWTESCAPATMILHCPDLMAEKGMPLCTSVSHSILLSMNWAPLPCRRHLLTGWLSSDGRAGILATIGSNKDGVDRLLLAFLEDSDEAEVLVGGRINVVTAAVGVIHTVACAVGMHAQREACD